MSNEYPYYIVTTHKGRLPVPAAYRGTIIARQFESGRIGGTSIHEERTTDKQIALSMYLRGRHGDSRIEFYIVESPNCPRKRLTNPEIELSR